MSTYVGIGFSQNLNPAKATYEAAEQAKQRLGQPRIDLAIIFITADYNPDQVIPLAHSILDNTRIVGCSTAGVILEDGIHPQGIGIMAIHSEFIKFENGYVSYINLREGKQAGNYLIQNSITDFGEEYRKMLVCFPDGSLNDLSALLSGIKEKLGATFPILGAGSCDNFQFKQSYQFHNNQIFHEGVSGVLIGGHFQWAYSSKHGWRPLGKPRTIDRVERNIIKSIDGKRPVSLYEEYFGEEITGLINHPMGQINVRYPLGVYLEESNEYLLRNVLAVEPDGGLVCQDTVPEGSRVHLMIGSRDSCLEGMREAVAKVKEGLQGKKPKLILVLESLKRQRILGKLIWKELQYLKNAFDEHTVIFGMCGNGEICTAPGGQTHLQNQSNVILALV